MSSLKVVSIESVLLVDCNEIDNFINSKILEMNGVAEICVFTNPNKALLHLKETTVVYQHVFIDVYFPVIDGIEFIEQFNKLELYKKQGEIIVLTASIDPIYKEKCKKMNVKYIEKPLTIEKFLTI